MDREPLFTDGLQVGIVVRDLDATVRTFVHQYGIGPWRIYDVGPQIISNQVNRDEPASFTARAAISSIGRMEIELLQPLDEDSHYAEILRTRGPGVHHLAMATKDFQAARSELVDRGQSVLIGGEFDGIPFAYMDTEPDLGFVTEIWDWPEGKSTEPVAVYPEPA